MKPNNKESDNLQPLYVIADIKAKFALWEKGNITKDMVLRAFLKSNLTYFGTEKEALVYASRPYEKLKGPLTVDSDMHVYYAGEVTKIPCIFKVDAAYSPQYSRFVVQNVHGAKMIEKQANLFHIGMRVPEIINQIYGRLFFWRAPDQNQYVCDKMNFKGNFDALTQNRPIDADEMKQEDEKKMHYASKK